MSAQVPHPRVPISDGTGLLTQPWYRFLTQFQRDSAALETSAGTGLAKTGGALSIPSGAVTVEMLSPAALSTCIIGNPYASAGAVQYIQAGGDNRVLGRFGGQLMFKDISQITTANVVDGNYGDITVSTGVWTVNAHAITFDKFVAATAAGIVGATAAGNFAQLTAAQAKSVLAIVAADVSGLGVFATGTNAANLTGTVAAAQLPALTGDVTSSAGSGALAIGVGKVTLAMQANVASGTIFYRKTALAGAPEVQTLATLKTDLGLTGTNSGDQTITLTGDVTGSGTGSFATAIGSGKVTLAMQANLAADSFIGNNTGSPATPIAMTVAQAKTLLAITESDVASLTTDLAAKAPLASPQFTGAVFYQQPSPTAVNATATLTIAQLLTIKITVTSTTAVSLTLPTGTLTDAGILSGALAVNEAFDWRIINLGSSSGAVTLVAGTGHTIVGGATVAIGTSAEFSTRKTATNTFVTYRIA